MARPADRRLTLIVTASAFDPPEFDRIEIIPSVTVFVIAAPAAAVALLCLSSLVACAVTAVL